MRDDTVEHAPARGESAVTAAGADARTPPAPVSTTQDEQPTAPIVPLDAEQLKRAVNRDADASEVVSPEPDGATAGPQESIGARDVWAAARARRRALRSEVRRFTARQRRRRLMWAGIAASLLLLVAATFGAAYSPLFAVEDITVVGADRLDATEVEEALTGQIGTPLALVDESAVKAALVGFPLVETYTLEARPPHGLVVRIVERTPIGYVESEAGFTLVDAAGVGLATTAEPGSDAPVVRVDGGVDDAAFDAAGLVIRSLPESLRPLVTAVTATSPNDVRLHLGETGTDIVWGSASDSADKALALEKVMISRPLGSVSEYDVSSPSAVVVR
ncbi:FtsQ-type POTRA domain-containing protein [Microbacterium koreense]|uniref:FtsQ-type POTRA domain-containing protein n=1 Tax=Microbacterium koreense TaxID=323761 RepID=A0ABW2ZT35_9MICO